MRVVEVVPGYWIRLPTATNSIPYKSVSPLLGLHEIRDKNTANSDFVLIYGESKVIAL